MFKVRAPSTGRDLRNSLSCGARKATLVAQVQVGNFLPTSCNLRSVKAQASLRQESKGKAATNSHPQARRLQATNSAALEYTVHQRLAEAVERSTSCAQLLKVLGSSSTNNASIAVTALMQVAGLVTRGFEEIEEEVTAYEELQVQLTKDIARHINLYPVDTQVAVAVSISQLQWPTQNEEVLDIYLTIKNNLFAMFDSCRPELVPTNLLFTALAYGEAGLYYLDLFDFLATQAIKHASSFKPLNSFVQLLGVFAQMRHYSPELMQTGSRLLLPALIPGGSAARGGSDELDAEMLATIAYSFATFDVEDAALYGAVQQAAALRPAKEWTPTAAAMMMTAQLLAPDAPSMPQAVGQALLKAQAKYGSAGMLLASSLGVGADEMMRELRETYGEMEDVSAMEQELGLLIPGEVRAALSALGLHSSRLETAGEGFFIVHITTSYKGQDVAVQIYNQASFCAEPHWRFRGHVVNELRCLERLGYRTVTVPQFEWVRIEEDPAARAQYLAAKLEEACAQ